MCRMLALVATPDASDARLPIWDKLVGASHSLRIQAEQGATTAGSSPGHRDSWGIGWFDADSRVSLVRQIGSAAESAYFAMTAESAARGGAESGPARVVVGHLRKASCGAVTSENAHPVRIDYPAGGVTAQPSTSMLVAHNGTLHEPLTTPLRHELRMAGRVEAESDSDTVVLAGYLALRLAKAWPEEEDFGVIAKALSDLFRLATEVAPNRDLTKAYSSANLLLAFGDGLLALRQFTKDADYYTLYSRRLSETERRGGGWVVASEPTDDAPGWQLLTPGVLYFYPNRVSTASVGVDAPRRMPVAPGSSVAI